MNFLLPTCCFFQHLDDRSVPRFLCHIKWSESIQILHYVGGTSCQQYVHILRVPIFSGYVESGLVVRLRSTLGIHIGTGVDK